MAAFLFSRNQPGCREAPKVKPGRCQGIVCPGDHCLAGIVAFTVENIGYPGKMDIIFYYQICSEQKRPSFGNRGKTIRVADAIRKRGA